MSKTKKVWLLLLFSMVWLNGAGHAQVSPATPNAKPNTKPGAPQQDLIHIVMINMSGKSREAHVRNTVVPLPVGERVALQVPPEASIKITSSTDRAMAQVITVTSTDEGRTFPVD